MDVSCRIHANEQISVQGQGQIQGRIRIIARSSELVASFLGELLSTTVSTIDSGGWGWQKVVVPRVETDFCQGLNPSNSIQGHWTWKPVCLHCVPYPHLAYPLKVTSLSLALVWTSLEGCRQGVTRPEKHLDLQVLPLGNVRETQGPTSPLC